MKVLIAAPTYLPSRRANTIQVMKMAQAVQSLGHEVRVLVPSSDGEKISDWNSFSRHYGLVRKINIHWLPIKPVLRGYDYGFRVVRHFQKWNGDILYTRLPQAAAWGSVLNVPTVFEAHDFPSGRMGPWLFRRFVRGRGARRLVVITEALCRDLRERIIALPGTPFTLIAPDGVDLIRYEKIPSPLDARQLLSAGLPPTLPIQTFTAGYTGHLYEGRGIPLILDMASRLPEVNFLLVGGDPSSAEKVRREVDQRQLTNIHLTGFIANSDLPLYQAACEVLLMPYQYQVAASSGGDIAPYLSPMKLFEYLACGRVILSSDLPVLREVLHQGNAILLPPENVDKWVETLKMVRDDPSKRQALSEKAREDSKRYSWEARAEKIFSPGI